MHESQAEAESSSDSFVRALTFKHRLRVCNAYPYGAALDVYKAKEDKLTSDEPMGYKQCRDFNAQLNAGDKLEFRVGDANAGTFSVSELPNNDAVLLLVIYRHDTLSTAVSFESHVFANLLNAQIAVIDTYKGSKKAALKIQDHENAKTSRSEELRFDSVVAVNPGLYDAVLLGMDGEEKVHEPMVCLNRESYVILRTGVEAQQGPSYPMELIVYPKSDASMLETKSGATTTTLSLFALLVAFVAWN